MSKEMQERVSRLYEQNFKVLMKETSKCSCSTLLGAGKTSQKCSNPKHWHAVKRERVLDKLSSKYRT